MATVMFAGQVIDGGWVSVTVTVNEQLPEAPPASVAVQVTVVAPTGKKEPEAGLHVGAPPGQLSVTVGSG